MPTRNVVVGCGGGVWKLVNRMKTICYLLAFIINKLANSPLYSQQQDAEGYGRKLLCLHIITSCIRPPV